MKLIVGLGNPGKQYEPTRHNLGFLVVDRIAARQEISLRERVCGALTGAWNREGESVILAKPQTYMNRSGVSVRHLLERLGGTPDDLLVVYDDIDLEFGRIRVRPKGRPGGHRGLASIAESLAGAPFPRVRVGIGRPPEGTDPADYVLEPFDAIQFEKLDALVEKASDAVLAVLDRGVETAMREFNRAL